MANRLQWDGTAERDANTTSQKGFGARQSPRRTTSPRRAAEDSISGVTAQAGFRSPSRSRSSAVGHYTSPVAVAGEAQVWMTPTAGNSSTVSADFAEMVAKQHERAAMEANLQFQEALADGTQPV